MSRPDLSVIIPVYNGAKTIGACLDSVLSQSGMCYNEIIVVNDGSTDDTGKIVRKYQANNTNIVLLTQKNAGVSTARNNGVDISCGKYISFVDADDTVGLSWDSVKHHFDSFDTYFTNRSGLKINHRAFATMPEFNLTPDYHYFARMLTMAQKYNADVALGGKITFNYEKNYIRRHMYDKPAVYDSFVDNKRAVLLHADVRETANAALYRREFLDGNNLRFETTMPLDEDMLFTMLAVLRADIVVTVPESAYVYNRCAGTASNIIDVAESEQKYSRAIVQRFSKLLPALAADPRWSALYTEWLRAYANQSMYVAPEYREFVPNDGCLKCKHERCGDCIMRLILDDKNMAAQQKLFQKQK